MLSSQIAVYSSSTMSPLLMSSMSSSTTILRSVGTLPRRSRPNHQIRTLRIGLWSSYLEPGFQKEMQHRQRALKHKYLNTVNRKLSWDRQSPILVRSGMTIKGFMCSAWRGQNTGSEDSWFGGRRKKGRQPERNEIEDLLMHSRTRKVRAKSFTFGTTSENAPIFLHRSMRSGVYPSTVDTRLNANSSPKNHGPLYSDPDAPASTNKKDGFETTSSVEQPDAEYLIDPITNRKVFRETTSNIPLNSAEEPDGKKGLAGLFKVMYEHIEHRRSSSLTKNPTQNKDAKRSCPVQEGLRDYDERVSYGPERTDKPNWTEGFTRQASVQDGLNEYDQVTSYEPGTFNGEISQNQQLDKDGLKEYDDSMSYEPGAFNGEPSIDPQAVNDGLNEYDSSVSYEPGAFNGEVSSIQDSTKDGLKEYDDSTSYEPGAFNGEIPGNLEPPSEPVSNDYDKITSYEPGPFNGDISSSEAPIPIDGLKDYDNSTSYEPGSFNGNMVDGQSSFPEAGLKDYDDATSYEPGLFNGNLSDTPEPKVTNGGLEDYDNSISYEAGNFNGKSRSVATSSSEDGLREYDEATSYEPGAFNGVNDISNSHPPTSGETRPSYPKLARYLEDLDTEQTELDSGRRASSMMPSTESKSEKLLRRDKLDKEFAATVEHDADTSASELRDRMNAIDAARNSNSQRTITGNFSRDFPEDFKKSWIATKDSSGGLMEKIQDTLQTVASKFEPSSVKMPDEEKYIDGRAEPSEFARTPDADKQRMETSFDRSQSTYSTSNGSGAMGNINGSTKKLKDQVRQIYESRYGKITADHRQSQAPSLEHTKPVTEPTKYKILAYDPTMQFIDIAETSSIVPDSASPLTPAEVLLRLSNPAKFFPHFGPLQAQGYEIVSGSGDVLVFRKVHEESLISTKSPSASHPERSRTNTNPIDGMEPIAATGNFASPTGFVNYDRPDPTEEPPFKSNIDMRREEEVFSGRSNWSEGNEQAPRKKRGLGKRVLVGGVMVGGASYAVGVVSDYFQSGERDGKRPKGF